MGEWAVARFLMHTSQFDLMWLLLACLNATVRLGHEHSSFARQRRLPWATAAECSSLPLRTIRITC